MDIMRIVMYWYSQGSDTHRPPWAPGGLWSKICWKIGRRG